jgi:hypothetical protein
LIACLAVWALAAGTSWLVGAAVLRVVRAAGVPGPPPDHSVTILFGLCCITVLGGVWSLGAPLGPWVVAGALAVLAAASAATLLFVPDREARTRRVSWVETALLGLVVAAAAAQAAGPILLVDTGLYHIQAIRWIEQHPAVPGLANLHHRLAFAAPWFEAQAIFDPALFGGRAAFALNGLVFVVAVRFFLGGIGRTGRGSGLLRLACLPAAFWLLRRGLSSASPDGTVALLSWVVLALLAEKIESGAAAAIDAAAWEITALACFAAMIKLPAALLLLAPAWLIVRNLRVDRRRALALAVLAAAVAVPFLLRSVIVSGYLLFPIGRVPGLAWTLPAAKTAGFLRHIVDAARLPYQAHVPVLDFAAWVPGWFRRLTLVERCLVAAPPVLALLHAARALRRHGRQAVAWPAGYPLLAGATFAGSLLWLLAAPDPRFGWGYFPLLAILLTIPLAAGWIGRLPRRALVLLVALVLLDQVRRVAVQQRSTLPESWLWPVAPPVVATHAVLTGGLAVRVPLAGELCWDAPLPCAPPLDPDVMPRGATLDAGWIPTAPPV